MAPLRVCVFGSSSARTKPSYLSEARELGRLIASGGHVCVNGAGRFGGMGALNEGALAAGGTVEGVIHKMCECSLPFPIVHSYPRAQINQRCADDMSDFLPSSLILSH